MNIIVKVAGVVFDSENKILLIKEKYREADGYKWNLIKGTFDHADETLDDCLRREIKEEVGLVAGQISLRKIFQYGTPDQIKLLFVFYVHNCTGEVSIPDSRSAVAGEDIQESAWFTQKDIMAMAPDSFIASYVSKSLSAREDGQVDIERL
ncbi:MAG: NUDIX hydrolase [Candidatus Kerfeldbacteria bacterium]|nr:NUDIX hydrolase [Candidatus Kerfeldbacteria bacterium]